MQLQYPITPALLALFSLSATARHIPIPPAHMVTAVATGNMVPAPSSFPITQPCLALPTYKSELNSTRTSIATKQSAKQALEMKQKLCHGCLTPAENDQHGKLDWDVQELGKVEAGQVDAVKCLEWMCGGDGKDGGGAHEVKKGGEMLKECVVLE